MGRTKPEDAQVMISLRVGTQAQNSKVIEKVLEEAGYETWICIEMEGGVDFRSEIVDTIDHIDVMILMIDTEWATSGECEAEFNLAYRKHLVSKNSPRKPTFLPVVFPNLDWNAHKHIRLLMASTNAIVVSQQKDMQEIGELLLSSIRSLGIEPRKPGQAGEAKSATTPKVKEARNLQKALQYWDSEDVCYYLEEQGFPQWVAKFKENKVNGLDLLHSSDEELKEGLGVSSFFIRKFFGELKTTYSLDLLQGEWSCKGELRMAHDGEQYETNSFGVKLENYGLVASGVNFHRKESTKKVDLKTFSTSVWQGRYDTQNNFHIVCKLSCDMVIEFLGQLELKSARLGTFTASLVEKGGQATKKFGTATFTFSRLVGRNRLTTVDLPPLPITLKTQIARSSTFPSQLKGGQFSEFKGHVFNWRWYPKGPEGPKIRVLTVEPTGRPQDSRDLGANCVFPMDLYSEAEDYYDDLEKMEFGLSYVPRAEYGDAHHVVTLVDLEEAAPPSVKQGELYPWALAGGAGYTDSFGFHFNWRWMGTEEGRMRVITLEDMS